MAGTILTPTAIWKNFIVEKDFSVQVLEQSERGKFTVQSFYIQGRNVKDGAVKIYCELTTDSGIKHAPAILLLQDFESQCDYQLITDLVEHGYSVLSVDLAGKREHKENFTKYPESIGYANYEQVKDKLILVEQDVVNTCWYEWTAVARTALAYLKTLPNVSKVGGFAIGQVATVLWQVAGTDLNLDSAVFAFNAGWAGYKGINKFSGEKEPQFSDDMYKFIAGIDAQSYAMRVNCPTLVLCATNSETFDLDRAVDTLSFVNPKVYSAVHYSVGSIDEINGSGYKNARLFFERTLSRAEFSHMRADVDVSGYVQDGKVHFEAIADQVGIKELSVYVAEQQIKPQIRSWQKLNFTKVVENKYYFEYAPYPTCGIVTFFAVATYQDGFSVGSKVDFVKIENNQSAIAYKSKVLYSSRKQNAESMFFSQTSDVSQSRIVLNGRNSVIVKRGPMGIFGISGDRELTTFKVAIERYKMTEGSMIMFDVFVPEKNQITVKLTCDYFGEKREYFARTQLLGGQVWKNVQIEMNKFKTEEGLALKSYEKVDAISFFTNSGEYLINNLLWV